MARLKIEKTVINYQPKTFTDCYKEFQQSNAARNLRPATIEGYYYTHKTLVAYYQLIDPLAKDIPLDKINNQFITTYVLYLKNERNNSAEAINTRLRKIKTMLLYMSDTNYIKPVKIKMLQVDKQVKIPYTEGELRRLLVKPKLNTGNFTELRNWTIINFLLATGMRLGSLIRLKIQDVDFSNRQVFLAHTKTHKQQVLPLTGKILIILRDYLKIRKGQPQDWLFCGHSGQFLTEHAIKQGIAKYNKARGVERTSIHAFRHTFALEFIKGGGNPFFLQRILGHASLDMTRQYVDMAQVDLRGSLEAFNPLERITTGTERIRIAK